MKWWFGKMEEGIGECEMLRLKCLGMCRFREEVQVRSHGMREDRSSACLARSPAAVATRGMAWLWGWLLFFLQVPSTSDITQMRNTVFENSHFSSFSWRLKNLSP